MAEKEINEVKPGLPEAEDSSKQPVRVWYHESWDKVRPKFKRPRQTHLRDPKTK